jgi:O-acetyl-ADP-ribose deacetylase (regulator of RNase III)
LNEGGGVFSPPGSHQRIEQESRASAGEGTLRSVLFPLFGTGQGGLPAADVLDPMLDGLLAVVSDRDFAQLAETLSDVYISTYMRDDLETITNALRERFQ